MNGSEQIIYFAETDFRDKRTRFGIKAKDRTRHVYVIGKTGTGKTALIENMAVQDMHNGNGFVFVDSHGDSAGKLLTCVPKERIGDVVYIAPFDTDRPVFFNILEDVSGDKRQMVVSGLVGIFEKMWEGGWNARTVRILSNTIFALLEYPGATLLDIDRMLADVQFRTRVVDHVSNRSIQSFWTDEYAEYGDRETQEAVADIKSNMRHLLSDPIVRNSVGRPKSSFDMRRSMDEKKIIIMDLSEGHIGKLSAKLLGSVCILKTYYSAMSRADLSPAELAKKPDFYLYIDEFPSFTDRSFADILSHARRYKLGLVIAHQYVEQIDPVVRSAIFGNAGTMIVFRIGSFDAEIFEKEFAPQFTAEDMMNLGSGEMCLRLLIDGIGSKPFSATALLPVATPDVSNKDVVIATSRDNYGMQPGSVPEDRRFSGDRTLDAGSLTLTRHRQEASRHDDQRPEGYREVRNRAERSDMNMNRSSRYTDTTRPSKEIGTVFRATLPPDGAEEEKTDEDISYISLSDLAKKVSERPEEYFGVDGQGVGDGQESVITAEPVFSNGETKAEEHEGNAEPEDTIGNLEKSSNDNYTDESKQADSSSMQSVLASAQEPQEVSEEVLKKILE